MPFEGELRPRRVRDYLSPDTDGRRYRNSAGNRLTATMLNALSIGAISAAIFVPSGQTTSNFVGEIDAGGVENSGLGRFLFQLSGETQELVGMGFLQNFASVLPYTFLFLGFILHLFARMIANRS